jgi:tetratricopeptide (TPR) repeat protein
MTRLRAWLALRLRRAAGPNAVMQLGVRDAANGHYDEALGEFTEAERLFRLSHPPTDPAVVSVMARRAWCLANLRRFDDAIALYKEAITAKETRGDVKEPTLQRLRDYLKDAEQRKAAAH